MADTIAKGAVVIGANTAGLESGLAGAQKQIAAFQTKLTDSFSFVGTGPAALAVGAGRMALDFIRGQFDEISQLGDKAEQIMNSAEAFGISTKQFQELSQAAKLSGVDIAEVEKGFKHMAETVVESQLGNADAIKKLKVIGLKPEDIAGKPTLEAFQTIAAAIGKVESPLLKVKAAADIFGKTGLKLLPILNDNVRSAMEAQSALGGVIPQETLQRLDTAADKIAQMGMAWDGLKARVKGTDFIQRGAQFYTQLFADISAAIDGPEFTGKRRPGEGAGKKTGADIVALQLQEAKDKIAAQQQQDLDARNKANNQAADDLVRNTQELFAAFGKGTNETKAYSLELKGLAGAQLEAAKSAGLLNDQLAAAKSLIQDNPVDTLGKQLAGLDAALAKGSITRDQYFAGVGRAAEALTAAGNRPMKTTEAIVAGSNEDVRARLQSQMMQAVSPTDAAREIRDKQQRLVDLGAETVAELKKLVKNSEDAQLDIW